MPLTHAEQKLLHITLKRIGMNIQKARMQRNFTLKKLSRQTNLKLETIDRYELGRTSIQLEELLKISIALDADLGKLMGK